MLIEAITLAQILDIVKIASAIMAVSSMLFGVFKVITWIKTKLTSIDASVANLTTLMDSNFSELRKDVKDQTTTIATALSEQRQDFRTFFTPLVLLQQQNSQFQQVAPVRAKRAAKKPVKRKVLDKKLSK